MYDTDDGGVLGGRTTPPSETPAGPHREETVITFHHFLRSQQHPGFVVLGFDPRGNNR